ncbi:TPA: hypothetical protein ACHYZ8_005009 [Pseudomonas aeruginosa]
MSMEMNKALDLLHGLVREVERKTCCHEETHRGGAIWEICDSCGAKWADDEGGKPEFAWPESVEKAREFLATHPAVEQAGGDRWDALQSIMEWTAAENIPDDRKLCLIRNAARAALAQPSPKCAACNGTGLIDDGEITCSEGGIPYENGPVKCVKDCPDCKAQPSPAQAEAERPEVVARVVHSNPVVLGQCGPLNANDELMTVAQHAASVARWAEMFNRVEQQRDAALVEVERLRESKGDPVGSLEKCMKVMYERDEHAKRLEAALARVAELETALEPFAAVADAYDDSEDDDHEPYTDMGCDDRLRLTLGQHRAGRIALERRTPQAQAQHSVPELLVRAEDFVSGFEDDDEQEGVSQLLADLRIAIGRAN